MNLDHIAIQVKNIQASSDWYRDNLKADVLYIDETWAMLKVGDVKLALTLASQHPPHWAVRINDEKDFPSNKEIGCHRDGSRYVYIEDPDGNVVEYVLYPD